VGRLAPVALLNSQLADPPHERLARFSPAWEAGMLWTIFVILLVLWLLGMVSSYTMGGFIHILLIVALAIVLIRVIQGRRPV
jgi:Family of unknown function (DUF5670)